MTNFTAAAPRLWLKSLGEERSPKDHASKAASLSQGKATDAGRSAVVGQNF